MFSGYLVDWVEWCWKIYYCECFGISVFWIEEIYVFFGWWWFLFWFVLKFWFYWDWFDLWNVCIVEYNYWYIFRRIWFSGEVNYFLFRDEWVLFWYIGWFVEYYLFIEMGFEWRLWFWFIFIENIEFFFRELWFYVSWLSEYWLRGLMVLFI